MENASKALIIAGAVLISIVLISLGVLLISRSGDSSKQASETSDYIEEQGGQQVNKIKQTNLNF